MSKDYSIEYIRVIACMGVVLIHVFKSAHDVCLELSQKTLFLYTAIINNLRWCVPVFLMITGYLLLNPEKDISIRKIGKYIGKIVIVLALFGTGFSLLELIFNTRALKVSMLFEAFKNMIGGNTWNHMWYLYTLIILYCFLPLLRALVKSSKQGLYFTCTMIIILASIFPTITAMGFKININLNITMIYVLYMLLGYLIKNHFFQLPIKLNIAGIIVSSTYLTCIAYYSDWLQKPMNDIFYNHASIAVLIQSICIFSLCSRWRKVPYLCLEKILLSIATASFGIYIMHMFYINLFYKAFHIIPQNLAEGGAFFIFTFTLTYYTVINMKKIPGVSKLL